VSDTKEIVDGMFLSVLCNHHYHGHEANAAFKCQGHLVDGTVFCLTHTSVWIPTHPFCCIGCKSMLFRM